MMQRWVVTGACGFPGSHLVDLLVSRGEEVVATDLPGADTTYVDRAGVPFVPADVTRKETLHPVFEMAGHVDGVFHFAELTSYAAPEELVRRVQCDGSANLFDVMLEHGTERVVVMSSGGVYGRPDRIPSDESFPLRPLTAYDRCKAEQEALIRRYIDERSLEATVLRPGAIYGPRSRQRAAIPLFLMALGQMPAIPGKGDVHAAFVHVKDVAAAARHVMTLPGAEGEVFNIADDTLMTLEDILFKLAPHVDAKVYNVHLPLWGLKLFSTWNARRSKKRGRAPKLEQDALVLLFHDTFMSNRKIKDTGFVLLYPSFIVGMVETIEWYKAQNWLWRDESFLKHVEVPGGMP